MNSYVNLTNLVMFEQARTYWIHLMAEKKAGFSFHHISIDEVYENLPHPNEINNVGLKSDPPTANVAWTSAQQKGNTNLVGWTSVQQEQEDQEPVAQTSNQQQTPKNRPSHAINARKIAKESNWTSQEIFDSGIRKTVQWYLNSQDWLQHALDGSYQREHLGSEKYTHAN